ncbi:Acyl-CoA N-acyltransferases (NAT) superfamily protein [Hibiscus syriacus]|uniref:Acyl-CoA N-acyltransferases (NAT) superfamily protein n=1 Tax=Hibiscus syriacus TaxID=106335 RepID=A0A6A2YRQ6_HIBSY|nr:Acyl-CoA N-acyltransferases (NAT) superfamily protein [Hibiscus syriacus]
MWDPLLLPCVRKDSELPSGTATDSTMLQENVSDIHSEDKSNQKNLLDEMSFYMENLNYLYSNDDDLTCDLQVDSGTLACVACGILGYPFMSVVQPCEGATMELIPANHLSCQSPTVLKPNNIHSCPVEGSISDNFNHVDLSLPSKDSPFPSITKHAVQVDELLQSKGGAKMLVICHSDYQKIKAQAIPVADAIGIPFNFNDVPLDSSSEEDLNLINFAIDDEHDQIQEDWTTELGVNLRYCVKVQKNSPFKQVQHALPLSGLFNDKYSSSELLNDKWKSRKYRSKGKLDHPSPSKPHESVEMEVDEILVEKLDSNISKYGLKIIQYSRRKKRKPDFSTGAGGVSEPLKNDLPKEDLAASSQLLDEHGGNKSKINTRSESIRTQLEVLTTSVVQKDQNKILEELDLDHETRSLTACASFQKECEIKLTESNIASDEIFPAAECSKHCISVDHERYVENTATGTQVCNSLSEGQVEKLASGYGLMNLGNSASSRSAQRCNGTFDKGLEDITIQKFSINSCMTSENEVQQETESTSKNNYKAMLRSEDQKEPSVAADSFDGITYENKAQKQEIQINASKEGGIDQSSNLYDEVLQETQATKRTVGDEVITGSDLPIQEKHPTHVVIEDCSEVHQDSSSQDKPCAAGTADEETVSLYQKTIARETGTTLNVNDGNGDCSLEENGDHESVMADCKSSVIPCEGLRRRARKDATSGLNAGCHMSFETKDELRLHKRNWCSYDGCGKKFRSHKYAILHQRVHDDDRPLKCPWKGCSMSFKWAWARIEHIRVHTGELPYQCKVEGCGLSFKFVSDYSRYRRKTGHYMNSSA